MANKKINQLDLFSGIGGFHLGFEKAGYKVKSYFSEVDKHAIAVYKQQFKNSEYVGSVIDIKGDQLPRIDLITFGSPCQDFSLAGKRKGMDGERSSLILEAIRLIGECRPGVFIWENVKGTFSSNSGEDFAAILQAFANIGGYRLEWQLLNTSWFLPQNRERIYLVGYSTKPGRNWRGVFPIGEDNRDDNKKRIKVVGDRGTGGQQGLIYGDDGIAPCVNSSTYKDPMMIKENIKIKSATKQGYEIAEEGDSINLSNPNSETRRGRIGKRKAQTLETSCNQAVVQPNYSNKALNETIAKSNLKEGEVKALDLYNRSARDECPTLTDPTHNSTRLHDGYRIRRLTPIECERLQGFSDNHTEYGNYDGEVKKISNTQRYKQCGNAVTVDVVQSIAEKIKPLF